MGAEGCQAPATILDDKADALGVKDMPASCETASLEPDEALRLRKKIDKNLLPMMIALNFVQFMDKATLGNAAVLGLIKDLKLTDAQYNWLGTIFFVAYLLFEFVHNRLLQRYPVGLYLALNGFAWAICVGAQAACTSFRQLMWCRFLLGGFEGSALSGLMVTTSMFYTHKEQTSRTAFWFLTNGVSVATSSFLGYGTLHIRNTALHPWQWFYIITALLTFTVSVTLLFFYPNSLQSAKFLTPEEREKAVIRIKVNQTGLENSEFKRYQAIEAIRDPKTWGFFFFAVAATMANITTQQSLIIHAFGFDLFQTTLLSSITGVVLSGSILIGTQLVRSQRGGRTMIGVLFSLPNTAAAIMSIVLPFRAKIPLLVAVYMSWFSSTSWTIVLGWITSVTAGYTKRLTVHTIFMVGFCIGNIIAPQLWQKKYKPRNIVPWSIILSIYIFCILDMIAMGLYLRHQNRIRDRAKARRSSSDAADGADDHQNQNVPEDSSIKVDKLFLDLTDIENEDFRYAY